MCRFSKLVLRLVVVFLSVSTQADSAEYVVGPADVNDVIAGAKAGDVIVFRNGVYNNVAIDFKPAEHGTAQSPITLRAETRGGVVFRGNGSRLRINRNHLIVDGFVWEDIRVNGSNDYVIRFNHVDDTVFRHNALRDVYNENMDAAAIRIASASDRNIIERNEFTAGDDSKDYRMLQVWAFSNSTPALDNVIRYNHFHDMGRAIQLGQGANSNPPDPYQRTTVEGNLFEKMHGYTVHIKTSGNSLINNTVRNARSAADVRSGRENRYIGNYFFDSLPIALLYGNGEIRDNYLQGSYNATDRGEGINLGWGDVDYPQTSQANPAKGYVIANNTIVAFADAGIDFDLRKSVPGHSLPPEDNLFLRNLIVSTAGKAIDLDEASDQTWESNIVHTFGTGSPGDTPDGVLVTDPGLALSPDGLFYSTKFPDVGADVSRRPLSTADVGPGSDFIYVSLAGDYNNDGKVNVADYTVWRDAVGSAALLPNDESPSSVTTADYLTWKRHFGEHRPTEQFPPLMTVPEPKSLVAAILPTASLLYAEGRRRRREAGRRPD